MHRTALTLLASGILVLALGGSASASTLPGNLAVNPSFETPPVAQGSYQSFIAGGDVGGWTVSGTGDVAIVSGSHQNPPFTFPAKDGSQWMDLTGNEAGPSGVKQTVATTPGGQYALVWYVGTVNDAYYGSSSTVTVLINDQTVSTATNSQGGTALTWQQFSHSFTAAGASTTIEFRNADPPGDHQNALDDVSLVPPDTSAPNGTLSGSKEQNVGKSVSATVACLDEACTATLSGKVTTSYKQPASRGAAAAKSVKKTFKLKPVTQQVPAGATATFKLKLSKKARKAVKKALKRGGKAKAKLTVKLSDAGGHSKPLKRTVKFKLPG